MSSFRFALLVVAAGSHLSVAALGIASSNCSSTETVDSCWRRWLEDPPLAASLLADELANRADSVVRAIDSSYAGGNLSGEIDVVCSGGGDLNGYYMGVLMVLSRLQTRGALRQMRHAGASAGGWMSFENALKGEGRTLESYLSYGLLEETYPMHFSTTATAVLLQDHHWRMMAEWQATKWNASLPALDGVVTLALSCKKITGTSLVLVDQYTSIDQAARAFIATGAIEETYEGMTCADGSGESGPNMTPLFEDGTGRSPRPQLVINLMHVASAVDTFRMGFGKFTSSQYAELVRLGQDEAAEWYRTGVPPTRDAKALTLCPKGARVIEHVCLG